MRSFLMGIFVIIRLTVVIASVPLWLPVYLIWYIGDSERIPHKYNDQSDYDCII